LRNYRFDIFARQIGFQIDFEYISSIPEVRQDIPCIHIYTPRVRDTLISHVKTAGGERADPDKTSHERHYLIDFARAERKFPVAQVELVPPLCPCPSVILQLSFFTMDCPKGVRRGYFAMRRRRTVRAFRDTSVIIGLSRRMLQRAPTRFNTFQSTLLRYVYYRME